MIRTLLLLAALPSVTAQDMGGLLRFVSCPVYRDTDAGRKSGCWLVSDPASGIRYDVTAAPTKPDWNHAVLVEGKIAAQAGDFCGGTVLDPVRVSVLEDRCTRHMLKAEGFKGRKFALPERNVRPLYQARKKPEKPFVAGRFTIPFDYRSSFISYQIADYYLDATINYALDTQPARIEITGVAQTKRQIVSGVDMIESTALARQRADVVRRALILRGISPTQIHILDKPRGPFVPAAFDGLPWPAARRVDIVVQPIREGAQP
jgi:hypothetical protein